MKAIQTQYVRSMDFKPSHIKAWAEGWGSVTVPFNGFDNPGDVHYRAVLALVDKVNALSPSFSPLKPPTIWGELPNGDRCYCFVNRVVNHVTQEMTK